MGKDRFNRFKPINWNNNWKTTGSKLSGNLSGQNVKHNRYPESHDLLNKLFNQISHYLNDWERQFMTGITDKKFLLTLKQKQTLEKIYTKYSKNTKVVKIDNFFQF